MNRRIKPLLLSCSVLLTLISWGIFLFHRIVITPDNSAILAIPFSDSEDYGEAISTVNLFDRTDDRIRFHYRLGENRDFPYIGFGLSRDSLMWNCTGFDKLTVELDPELSDRFSILLATFVDGFSSPSKGISYRLFEKDIDRITGSRISVQLNSFQTPTWWFGENGLDANDNRESLKKVDQIRFQSHPLAPRDEILKLQIRSVTISHSFGSIVPFLLISIILAVVSALIQSPRIASFVPLNVTDRAGEELLLLEEYLGKEYARLDMSLQKTVLETGLSETAIRELLKKFHRKGFKEYLNGIRLSEGARLLRESDRQIAEIALYTGFRHATTFTKLFRDLFGFSPSEYRDKMKKGR